MKFLPGSRRTKRCGWCQDACWKEG